MLNLREGSLRALVTSDSDGCVTPRSWFRAGGFNSVGCWLLLGQTGSNVLMAPLLKEIQFVTLLVDNLACRCSGALGDTLNKDRIIKDL